MKQQNKNFINIEVYNNLYPNFLLIFKVYLNNFLLIIQSKSFVLNLKVSKLSFYFYQLLIQTFILVQLLFNLRIFILINLQFRFF